MLDVMLRDPIVEQAMRIKMQKIDHDRARDAKLREQIAMPAASSAPEAEGELDRSDE
jgi:hypothetical protein